MANEGDAIRGVATKMRKQVEKVNTAANRQMVQRAVHGALARTKETGQKTVTLVRRRAG